MGDDQHDDVGRNVARVDDRGLTRLSLPLVKRGLELIHQPSWEHKLIFDGLDGDLSNCLSVSPAGKACRPVPDQYLPADIEIVVIDHPSDRFKLRNPSYPPPVGWPEEYELQEKHPRKSVWENSILRSYYTRLAFLYVHGGDHISIMDGKMLRARWSPCGRFLILVLNGLGYGFVAFDVEKRRFIRSFGRKWDYVALGDTNAYWSPGGKYVATRSVCITSPDTSESDPDYVASFRLWRLANRKPSVRQMQMFGPQDRQQGEKRVDIVPTGETLERDGICFFMGFSPDERRALVGWWRKTDGKHLISIVDVRGRLTPSWIEMPGPVRSDRWAEDSTSLFIDCGDFGSYRVSIGQAASFTTERAPMPASPTFSPLPFKARRMIPHPYADVLASCIGVEDAEEKVLIRITDRSGFMLIDECLVDADVDDICWSKDGARLYAITCDGTAHTYRLPEGHRSRST